MVGHSGTGCLWLLGPGGLSTVRGVERVRYGGSGAGAGLRWPLPALRARECDVRGGPAQLCDQQRGWGKLRGDWRERLKTNRETDKQTDKPLLILLRNFHFFGAPRLLSLVRPSLEPQCVE